MPRGVTLLELLVVILIVMMVTAAAIPIMAPALQNRRMREAARLTSGYLSGARARAIATGRDVGVVIERFNGNPFAMSLSYVEVPPPYGGDTTSAVCTVKALATPGQFGLDLFDSPSLTTVGGFNPNLVHVGDQVQLGYQGPLYRVFGPDTNNDGTVDPPISPAPALPESPFKMNVELVQPIAGTRTPWVSAPSPPVPYQVFRQPIRSSAAPLQLPDGVVIDLMHSGMGIGGIWGNTAIPPSTWLTTTNPPVPFNPLITFTPGGAVGYLGTTILARPTGPIFLLLGRRELMADVTKSVVDENLYDPAAAPATPKNLYLTNFWISIGYQTGLVTVAEMAVNPRPPSTTPTVADARAFSQTSQGIGGQ